jgi:predicted aconitase with swiveling domain
MSPAGAEPPVPARIRRIRCAALHPGTARGELVELDEALSFWGGVSVDGTVIDRHHPQHGASLTGRVVAMPSGRGSSSSSSVLAEQIRVGTAPAAILLAEPDAILVVGAMVAAELYDIRMPVLQLAAADLAGLPRSGVARVHTVDGATVLDVELP